MNKRKIFALIYFVNMHLFIKFSSGEHSSTRKNRTDSILQAHVAKVRAFDFIRGKRSRSPDLH